MKKLLACATSLLLLVSCGQPNGEANASATGLASQSAIVNVLQMKVDGKLWQADREIIGMYEALGVQDSLLIAGDVGPKDKYQQTFNLNLQKVTGPGTYQVNFKNVFNAAQLLGYSEQLFMIGGALGADIQVVVEEVSDTKIVAKFSGSMTSNEGKEVQISEGIFVYSAN